MQVQQLHFFVFLVDSATFFLVLRPTDWYLFFAVKFATCLIEFIEYKLNRAFLDLILFSNHFRISCVI